MKKKILFLFLMLSFFMNVQAKSSEGELLATCSYKDNVTDFSIKIYDNGNLEFDPEAGEINRKYFGYNNLNKKNYFKKVYSNDQLSASCPVLYGCNIDDYNHFISDKQCTNGTMIGPLNGTMVVESTGIDQKEDKSHTFCKRQTTSTTDDLQKIVTFKLDSDGNKIFELYDNKENPQGATANFDESVYIHDVQFFIDENAVDLFWNDETCDNTEIYAERYNGSAKVIILTAEKPDDWQDSSPDNSNGFEEDNNNDDYNKEFNPKTLCEEAENCNISLANFCTKGTVARTFKFLGLLFYIAKILVPAIVIIMGFVNLFNIMMAGKIEEAKKYGQAIIIRVLVGIGIFLLPGIIDTIYNGAKTFITSNGTGGFDNCESCLLNPNSDKCYIEES